MPRLVPSVPDARSPAAWTLLAVGLLLFAGLAIRAANTFLLTRRIADLAVVVGLVLLACSLFGALALTFMDLGWWIGHLFELIGIALVGASVAYDLRRGSQSSRPLVGDLRASEVVFAEEAFLGARVRAIMVRLAEKDSSTEEHTRRVAALAVEVGEALGLSGARLRDLAIGGLLHDVGKLSVPSSILQKPGPLDDDEFEVIKQHPQQGRELLAELGGFDEQVGRLVLDHHERLDGSGYPRGLSGRSWISRRGSSPSATSTTPSSRRGSIAPPGRTARPSPCSRRSPGWSSIRAASRHSSAWCRATTWPYGLPDGASGSRMAAGLESEPMASDRQTNGTCCGRSSSPHRRGRRGTIRSAR